MAEPVYIREKLIVIDRRHAFVVQNGFTVHLKLKRCLAT